MSVITTSPPLPPILPNLPVRRFTVDEYHQMIQAGVLGEDDDVELLEGWINLVDNQVEVYSDPTGPDAWPVYRSRQDYHVGDLVPFVIDGCDLGSIPAQELLP